MGSGVTNETQPPIRQMPTTGKNGRGRAIGQLLKDIHNGTIKSNFQTVTRKDGAVTTTANGMVTLAGDKQTVPYEVTYIDQKRNGLHPGDFDYLSVKFGGLIFTVGDQNGQPTSHIIKESLSAWKKNNVGPDGTPFDSGRPANGGGYTVHNATQQPDYLSTGSYMGQSVINPETNQEESAINAIPKELYENFALRVLGADVLKPR
jgi:hypothetical protein